MAERGLAAIVAFPHTGHNAQWEADSRSHDHAFLGTVDDWLYQRVAGIEPAAPGYTKVTVKPYPVGGLSNGLVAIIPGVRRTAFEFSRRRIDYSALFTSDGERFTLGERDGPRDDKHQYWQPNWNVKWTKSGAMRASSAVQSRVLYASMKRSTTARTSEECSA